MGRPRRRETNDLTDDDIRETYDRHRSLTKASVELGMSRRTLQRELKRLWMRGEPGRRPMLSTAVDDHLAIARAAARVLPDLRRERIVLRDVEGNAIPSQALGAYTIAVSRRDGDHIRINATLVNGREIEVATTITHVKELLNETGYEAVSLKPGTVIYLNV